MARPWLHLVVTGAAVGAVALVGCAQIAGIETIDLHDAGALTFGQDSGACSPNPNPAFVSQTISFATPSCTTSQVQTVAQCLVEPSPSACIKAASNVDPALASCLSCVDSDETSSVWGAFVNIPVKASDGSVFSETLTDIAGCVAKAAPASPCGPTLAQLDTCALDACSASCTVKDANDSAGGAALLSCLNDATTSGECVTKYDTGVACANDTAAVAMCRGLSANVTPQTGAPTPLALRNFIASVCGS